MSIKTGLVKGVATLEIARPEKKNALTLAMYQALADALTAAQANPQVRAVLITGQPGIFTSGNDLEDFLKNPPGAGGASFERSAVAQFMFALLDCEKPVIAAVTGAAIGIGTTMLQHCDFVFVADDAKRVTGNLGSADRGKLEEYLTAVRQVEERTNRYRVSNQKYQRFL